MKVVIGSVKAVALFNIVFFRLVGMLLLFRHGGKCLNADMVFGFASTLDRVRRLADRSEARKGALFRQWPKLVD